MQALILDSCLSTLQWWKGHDTTLQGMDLYRQTRIVPQRLYIRKQSYFILL